MKMDLFGFEYDPIGAPERDSFGVKPSVRGKNYSKYAKCIVEDCDDYPKGHGLCSLHYQRWKSHGDTSLVVRKRICSVEDCDNEHSGNGFCSMHYQRWRKYGDPLKVLKGETGFIRPYNPEMDQFFQKALGWNSDDCLIWPFGPSHGPARFDRLQKIYGTYLVSKVVCLIKHGRPPTAKHEAAHSCGKGHLGCINPHHLRWATRSENHADKLKHGTHARGERNPMSKLTESDVFDIRQSTLSQRELADKYGIWPQTVGFIRNYRKGYWNWLVNPNFKYDGPNLFP